MPLQGGCFLCSGEDGNPWWEPPRRRKNWAACTCDGCCCCCCCCGGGGGGGGGGGDFLEDLERSLSTLDKGLDEWCVDTEDVTLLGVVCAIILRNPV